MRTSPFDHVLSSGTLWRAPRCWRVEEVDERGLDAIWYEGPTWQGRPTRVFAWVGLPAHASAARPVPGIVLIHGGGGTAFASWVRLWNSRGYAAIAMDHCGGPPTLDQKQSARHAFAGPPGCGGFDQIDQPVTDQWSYHAVANTLLAHSLLASYDAVDRDRIGMTGVSWGGVVSCIAAGLDPRWRFAAVVYGCGHLRRDSRFRPELTAMPDGGDTWTRMWDPACYLPQATAPMLWITGVNDPVFPISSLRDSYRLPAGPRVLSIQTNLPHGHGGPGENPPEIHAFADQYGKHGVALARIEEQGITESCLLVRWSASQGIRAAQLVFTRDRGPWLERTWHTQQIPDPDANPLRSPIPTDATAIYVNLIDERGLCVSGEHLVTPCFEDDLSTPHRTASVAAAPPQTTT